MNMCFFRAGGYPVRYARLGSMVFEIKHPAVDVFELRVLYLKLISHLPAFVNYPVLGIKTVSDMVRRTTHHVVVFRAYVLDHFGGDCALLLDVGGDMLRALLFRRWPVDHVTDP